MAQPVPPGGTESHRLTLNAGEYLYRAGDVAAEMYVIRQGEVELLANVGGAESRVAMLATGDLLGELGLLDGTPRESSARAVTPCELLAIDLATLSALVQRRPEIALHMLRRLSRRRAETLQAPLPAAPAPEPAVTKSGRVTRPTRATVAAPAGGGKPPTTSARTSLEATARLVAARPGSTTFYTLGQTTTIGRTLRNTIVIPAPDVSRLHARIDLTPTGFVLTDLGSQNGTFVNGERIKERLLRNNDEVRVGHDASFVFLAATTHGDSAKA